MSNTPFQPWKRLNRQTVYQNPWITVYEDQVQLPTGHVTPYGVVTPTTNFVGIVPLLNSDTVVLVRQYRYVLGETTWEIPSGGMEKDEQPETAAQRELREEIGYQADHLQLISIMHSNKSIMDDRGYIFLAQGLTPSKALPDETEEFEVISMSLEKALDMVRNYEITDCVSIIGLLLAHSNSVPKL